MSDHTMSFLANGDGESHTTNGHSHPVVNGVSMTNGRSSSSPTSSNFALPLRRSKGQSGDEEEEEGLNFKAPDHHKDLLAAMLSLQREHQFCDATLRVGERELPVHRAVLAAASPVLFELFSRAGDLHHTGAMYKLKHISFQTFKYILDYMYTGRLHVTAEEVRDVYKTARALRVEQVARACSTFLASRLTPANCLGVRKCACEDEEFRGLVDDYIHRNIDKIINNKHFYGLPDIKVEIIGAEEALERGGSERQLFNLVLEWARTNVDESKPKVELLTEEVNVLFLNTENHLQDCKEVNDSTISEDDLVSDYKKHSRRRSVRKQSPDSGEHSQITNGGKALPFHKFSISPERSPADNEWSIIAISKQGENSYVGLAVLFGKTMTISLHLRHHATPTMPQAAVKLAAKVLDRGDQAATLKPLETMTTSRCAFGTCLWNDSIVVFGGYDRGQCLVSVEAYSIKDDRWSQLPNMKNPRARFGAAAIGDRLYAIGGSDGTQDLDSVHCLDFSTNKWKAIASLNVARSSVGAAELNGQLYCVGGSEGRRRLASCEMYDLNKGTWTFFASLNIARYQAAVSTFAGGLVAVGGTDSWNCLSSVEIYTLSTNTWTIISPLNSARRGAGIAVFGDKLWVIGGSDGVSSLRTTEFYDEDSETWTYGPQLNVPRANVSAVSMQGSLYAIGGYSGKKFLNTMEVLCEDKHQWCGFLPQKKQNGQAAAEAVKDNRKDVKCQQNGDISGTES